MTNNEYFNALKCPATLTADARRHLTRAERAERQSLRNCAYAMYSIPLTLCVASVFDPGALGEIVRAFIFAIVQ